MADLQDFAGVVALAIKAAMAPVLERVALMEAQVKSLSSVDTSVTALRERLVVAETKAAMVVPPSLPDGVIDRLTALEQRPTVTLSNVEQGLSDLRERVVVAETKYSTTVAAWDGFSDRVTALESKSVTRSADDLIEIQQRLTDLSRITDRMAALETKTAEPLPLVLPEFITSGRFHMMAEKADRAVSEVGDLAKDVGALRERVAVVEVRQPVPGPPGPAGIDGTNGTHGKDGIDGLGFDDLVVEQTDRSFAIKARRGDYVKTIGTATFPVLIHRDVWLDGKSYERGDMVTWAGSSWHCNEPTSSKPGESKAWTLTVKRGRDGKDGKDAQILPVVKVGA